MTPVQQPLPLPPAEGDGRVYVDAAVWPFGRMIMCHMVAERLEDLHAMADRIGIARRWFQNKGMPHYDICKSKRKLAVKFGAIEVSARELVMIGRKHSLQPQAKEIP